MRRNGANLTSSLPNQLKSSPGQGFAVAESAKKGLNGSVGKRLLDVGEAAVYLGLQVDTVYKKARLRELPSVKVGRALRFDVVALERYVEQHTIENLE